MNADFSISEKPTFLFRGTKKAIIDALKFLLRPKMEQLIAKVRRVPQLRSVSDALLLALLANSDYLPDRVFSGVIREFISRRTVYAKLSNVNVSPVSRSCY